MYRWGLLMLVFTITSGVAMPVTPQSDRLPARQTIDFAVFDAIRPRRVVWKSFVLFIASETATAYMPGSRLRSKRE